MAYHFQRYLTKDSSSNIFLKVPSTKQFNIYHNNILRFQFDDTPAGNDSSLIGGAVAGYDLILKANSVDAFPLIELEGGSHILCKLASGGLFNVNVNGQSIVNFDDEAGSGYCRIHARQTNSDIKFQPDGTGLVRFGTYAATGDVVCNGYISIKDEAGTTRKLMTTA